MKRMTQMCLVSILALFTAACAIPFAKACRDIAQDPKGDFQYTARQAAVACDARAQFYADDHLFTFDKDTKVVKMNLNGLRVTDLEKVLQDEAKSIDGLLSYQDTETADWIDWSKGFRQGLEKQEQVVLEILRRLNYVHAYNDFTDAVGELPESMQTKVFAHFFPNGRKYYSMRLLYPRADKSLEDIPFTAEYLESAKRDGTLKLVDSFEIASSREFAKRIPNLQDANDFSWEKQSRGWVIKSYKVMPDTDKPADNVVHYIEIYRKSKDLSGIESKPAVRGFMAAGGSKVSVFVVDYDREGEQGYGSPDAVVKTYTDITTGNDLYTDSTLKGQILDSLYDSPKNAKGKPDRRKPRDRQIYTAIVKMGEAPLDVWEQGTFTVPFDYKTLSQNMDIMYAPSTTPEEKRIEEREKLKKIKLFVHEYKQDGKVVVREYWLPKKDYGAQNIADSVAYTDTIKIRRKNGLEESGEVAYFAERVKAVDYLFGGKCFRIVDEKGTGSFEKKRAIACPAGMTDTPPPSSSEMVVP